jgi:hypothetical protein
MNWDELRIRLIVAGSTIDRASRLPEATAGNIRPEERSMEKSSHIRWEVKLFEAMGLPEQGFVFFLPEAKLRMPSERTGQRIRRMPAGDCQRAAETERGQAARVSACRAARVGRLAWPVQSHTSTWREHA